MKLRHRLYSPRAMRKLKNAVRESKLFSPAFFSFSRMLRIHRAAFCRLARGSWHSYTPYRSPTSLARKMILCRPVISRMTFLEGGNGGNHSQEQTRRVCDAANANMARAESMRKPLGAGHAMPRQRMVSPALLHPPYAFLTGTFVISRIASIHASTVSFSGKVRWARA